MPAAIRPDRFCVRLEGATVDGADVLGALVGGKARSLLELSALGLPVPRAIAVTTALYAALRANGPPLPATLAAAGALVDLEQAARALAGTAWPAGFAETLAREIDTLVPEPGARFSVRSSADVEDRAGALAAGLFLSRTEVPRDQVVEAVRAVLGSALSPAVVAYLARAGLAPDAMRFAVLIHPFVVGEASGIAAMDPSAPEPMLLQSGERAALPPSTRAELESALGAIVAARGPSEVEWVASGEAVTFLQVRPFRRSAARRVRPSAPALGAGWRWDAAHNPLPLSPAQAGLVAVVDERCRIGLQQRVVGGYLFYKTEAKDDSAPSPIDPAEALRAVGDAAAERLAEPSPTLEQAIETFVAAYEPLFGRVQPITRARRAALADFLQRHGLDPERLLPELLGGVPSAATERDRRAHDVATATGEARQAALAEYLAAFGDESPRWDVAAPTWRETPAALERRLTSEVGREPFRAPAWREAADAIAARLPAPARSEWPQRLELARAAAAVAEDDDAIYARLQAHVRSALLREGARLAERGTLAAAEDVFWLPLERVRDDARGGLALATDECAGRIAAARRSDEEARADPPTGRAADPADTGRGLVRGRPGANGTRIGRVWRRDLNPEVDPPRDPILVARTLLPTELPLLSPAAIVVETGGPLDHVAAQARERGIPAVVGAAGACDALSDGDFVLVDGAAGLVVRLA